MQTFAQQIAEKLGGHGIQTLLYGPGQYGLQAIEAKGPGNHCLRILSVEILCCSPEDARRQANEICMAKTAMQGMASSMGTSAAGHVITVTRDRWESQHQQVLHRLLAHCGIFSSVFARNCEARRIDRKTAKEFMSANHSYGNAKSRYCYGLFIKRYPGSEMSAKEHPIPTGTMIAAAEFSNARRWQKGDNVISSYEWVRYASLPGVRVTGGMGKLLKKFIREVSPDDIMSYADMEWSDGDVYRQLGFTRDGEMPPVLFSIDPSAWERVPAKYSSAGPLWYMNSGSIKYRLKLTEY
ncbi:MAG: hypothetical protein NC308_04750 [Clostridium sp.]|nr:hypothetical protein [Bacteroides sp.]MCM1198177.1 hypothetical protein [Clostridium sp.]